MLCRIDSKHIGGDNAIPWVFFVDIINVKRADDISNILINVFYDSIGLWVPSCDSTALDSIVFATHPGES